MTGRSGIECCNVPTYEQDDDELEQHLFYAHGRDPNYGNREQNKVIHHSEHKESREGYGSHHHGGQF